MPPLVVVDNGSDDHSVEVVDRARCQFPSVADVVLSRNEGAVALNYGAQTAFKPFVAFCDDDSSWPPQALVRTEALFDAELSTVRMRRPLGRCVAASLRLGLSMVREPAVAGAAVSTAVAFLGLWLIAANCATRWNGRFACWNEARRARERRPGSGHDGRDHTQST